MLHIPPGQEGISERDDVDPLAWAENVEYCWLTWFWPQEGQFTSAVSAALKRSGLLTKGERGRIFAIGLLTTIVSSALTLAIQAPFMLAGRGISGIGMSSHNDLLPSGLRLLSDIAEGMAEAFTAPLMMIALVLLYYDVRVRREGFDLQVMMTALDRKDPISAPVVRTVTT